MCLLRSGRRLAHSVERQGTFHYKQILIACGVFACREKADCDRVWSQDSEDHVCLDFHGLPIQQIRLVPPLPDSLCNCNCDASSLARHLDIIDCAVALTRAFTRICFFPLPDNPELGREG